MARDRSKPFRIIVLGGGTAGWMAACLLAHYWRDENIQITAIESSEVGIVGVGEGSTPQLKAFFKTLGVTEAQWMPKCNATYKNGISFHGWSTAAGCASYFHPFPSPIDAHTAPGFHHNSFLRRQGVDLAAHPDRFFLSAKLAQKQLAPIAAENFPFEIAYGYHFDAHLVGQYLRGHAVGLGVRHSDRKIEHVKLKPDGQVECLVADNGEEFSADFFIDATGFRALILQQALGVKFLPFQDNLFNDCAVVMPTPRSDAGLASATKAIAMRHGWRWDIPLTSRTGNGYVFSSSHCSVDEAETELRAALGLLESDVAARALKMRVGRVEKHWVGNCLAIGLSQGFIEPLEATALHLVQSTIETFIATFAEGDFTNAYQDKLNRLVNDRFEGVRDYIVCHYKMNLRSDTPYWTENAINTKLSNSLAGVLASWFAGKDIREEVRRQDIGRYYNDVSWACLIGGYGQYPKDLRQPQSDESRVDMAIIDDFVERCSRNFAPHAQALKFDAV